MIDTIHSINIILPVFYAVSIFVYLQAFRKQTEILTNSKRIFLFVTLLLHTFYLLSRTNEFNHPPITSQFEIFTLLAFSIGFSYFVLELLTDIRGTGVFIITIAFIFQVISSCFIKDNFIVPEVLRNRLLGIHVISAILGYSGFAMSAVYGILFMMLYKSIKLSTFGLIFSRLPSLETLEKLNFYSVVIGYVFLTIAMIIGIIWLPDAFPDFSFLDPKLVTTTLIWIIFGTGIMAKLIGHWYGKKVIIFTIVGFIIAILSIALTNIIATSFHAFY